MKASDFYGRMCEISHEPHSFEYAICILLSSRSVYFMLRNHIGAAVITRKSVHDPRESRCEKSSH